MNQYKYSIETEARVFNPDSIILKVWEFGREDHVVIRFDPVIEAWTWYQFRFVDAAYLLRG